MQHTNRRERERNLAHHESAHDRQAIRFKASPAHGLSDHPRALHGLSQEEVVLRRPYQRGVGGGGASMPHWTIRWTTRLRETYYCRYPGMRYQVPGMR